MLLRAGGLLAIALLGLGTLAEAASNIRFTNVNFNGIQPGVPFDITWAGDGTSVAIYLLNGPPGNLQTVATITPSTTNFPFAWTPSTAISPGTYALSIVQSGTTNYSPQFNIASGATPSSSTTSSTTTNSPSSTPSSTSSIPHPTHSFSSTATTSSTPSTAPTTSSSTSTTLFPSSSPSSTATWAPTAFFIPNGHTTPSPLPNSTPSPSLSSSTTLISIPPTPSNATSTSAPFPYPNANGTMIVPTAGVAHKTPGASESPVSFAGKGTRVKGWGSVAVGMGVGIAWVLVG